MIDVRSVSKYFGRFQALKSVSFQVARGEIIGFLGQNGAGKTTLMRILTTYLPASEGRVTIAGMDTGQNSLAVRRRIGYLPENPPLYGNLTVRQYLMFAADLKEIPPRQQRPHVERVLSECDLLEVRDKIIANLSKGYKQRVGIAQAILHEPEVLILDEPTNGLDPWQILQVRKLIKNLEYRRTVILSTHILSEIEQIVRRVLIIKSGAIVADASLEDLLAGQTSTQEKGRKIFLRVQGNRPALETAVGEVSGIKIISWTTGTQDFPLTNGADDPAVRDHQLDLELPGRGNDLNALVEPLLRSGGRILEIRESRQSLEDAFLKITG